MSFGRVVTRFISMLHVFIYVYAVLTNGSVVFNGTTNDIEMEPIANRIAHEAEPLLKEVRKEGTAALTKLKNASLLTMPDPWDIATIQPKLVFYHKNRTTLQVDYKANPREVAVKLLSGGYLDSARLVFITHGFHNNFDTDWLHQFKDLIFNASTTSKVDHTVALLGWGGGADLLVFRYRQAASNVMPVGQWLANFTKAINDVQPKLPIYGIGHSLGAHVMGIAGRVSKAFDRITGWCLVSTSLFN